MSSKKRIEQMKYAFKHGVRYGVDADIAGEELSRIQRENGVLSAAAVVDAARPDEAPLHPVFEWRDEVAAESYRTWQARKLIKSVEVIGQQDGKPTQSPVYVHVPQASSSDGEDEHVPGGYQPVSVVVGRPDMYASALSELVRRVRSAKEAVEGLRKAAEGAPDTDQERMARISIAVQAMQTASAAVQALH